MTIAFFSLAFAIGTYFILEMDPTDCSMMGFMLWMVIILHTVNLLVTLLNLTGLEQKLCNSNMVCVFVIFEFTMLIWMQVTYFHA